MYYSGLLLTVKTPITLTSQNGVCGFDITIKPGKKLYIAEITNNGIYRLHHMEGNYNLYCTEEQIDELFK